MNVYKTLFVAVGLLSAMGVGLGGCSDDSNSEPLDAATVIAQAGPVPEEQFSSALLAAACEGEKRCCTPTPMFDLACPVTMGLFITPIAMDGKMGKKTYHPDIAGKCVAAMKFIPCSTGDDDPTAEYCGRVYTGDVLVGDECAAIGTTDCKKPEKGYSECISTDPFSEAPPVCAQRTIVALGEPCTPPDQRSQTLNAQICEPYKGYCNSDTQRCEPVPKLGEPCSLDCFDTDFCNQCEANTWCDGSQSAGSSSGVCSARLANGETCHLGTQCESLNCNDSKCSEQNVVQQSLCVQ